MRDICPRRAGIASIGEIAASCGVGGRSLVLPVNCLEKEDWIGQAKHFAKRREIELANRAATHRD